MSAFSTVRETRQAFPQAARDDGHRTAKGYPTAKNSSSTSERYGSLQDGEPAVCISFQIEAAFSGCDTQRLFVSQQVLDLTRIARQVQFQ